MHRTSTRSPPFLNEDESNWRTLRNYTNKKRIMMKYKKLWKTMIHSLKDKCFKMHFTELQDTKKGQMTSPPHLQAEKMNQSNTHTPPTNTKNIFFISFFGKMFEIVREWTLEETNLDYFEKWPQETPQIQTKSTCLDTLYLFKEKCF